MAMLVAALMLCGLMMGCGQSGPSASQEGPPAAWSVQDGAPKFYEEQITCPVCGESPIKGEYYADVGSAKLRVYFDSQECLDTFNEDPQKYIQEWEQRRASAGGMTGEESTEKEAEEE